MPDSEAIRASKIQAVRAVLIARAESLEEADSALEEIENAINKIDAGIFGQCERCGEEIDQRRLAAMPTSPVCATCAEFAE